MLTVDLSGGVTALNGVLYHGGAGYAVTAGAATTGGEGTGCTIDITVVNADGWVAGAKIPGGADIAAMETYLEEHVDPVTGLTVARPAGIRVRPYGLKPKLISFTIALTPDTTAVRAAVITELEDLMLDFGGPDTIMYRNDMITYIGQAEGEVTHTLTTPAADVSVSSEYVAYIAGTDPVTWT